MGKRGTTRRKVKVRPSIVRQFCIAEPPQDDAHVLHRHAVKSAIRRRKLRFASGSATGKAAHTHNTRLRAASNYTSHTRLLIASNVSRPLPLPSSPSNRRSAPAPKSC